MNSLSHESLLDAIELCRKWSMCDEPIQIEPQAAPWPAHILAWARQHFSDDQLPLIQDAIIEGIVYKTVEGWPASRIAVRRRFERQMRAIY